MPRQGPTPSRERIDVLDVLRGIALFGVFFSNVHVWFSGRIFLPPSQVRDIMSHLPNVIIDTFERYCIGGRFITIFAFLFGVGLAMQFDRAAARGDSASRFYLRRGSMMLLLGAVHLFGLWFGDILHLYALLGFVVLVFRRQSEGALFVWALLCTFIGPMLVKAATVFVPPLLTTSDALAAEQARDAARAAQLNASMLTAFAQGSYLDIVRANAAGYWGRFVDLPSLGFDLEFLGKILLGYHAGRIRFFDTIESRYPTLRRILVAGLLAALLSELAVYGLTSPASSSRIVPIFNRGLRIVQSTGTAAFYVAGITLLFRYPAFKRILAVFSPTGRMAVTNYLTQSVMAVFFFYGIGLGFIGTITPLTTLVFPLVFYACQVGASHIVLRHFQMGPIEWVWRRVTYASGTPQIEPNRQP
jgi:uncharacterized protein